MKNIKHHKICIPHEIIDKCWPIYHQKYKEIEEKLLDSRLINHHLHTTGAFQLERREIKRINRDPLFDYFTEDKSSRVTLNLKTKQIFRGLDYFVGIRQIDNCEKLKIIKTRLLELLSIAQKITPASNTVLHLALLDYVRNYLLMLLYAINQTSRELGGGNNIRSSYGQLVELLTLVEETFVANWVENNTFQLYFSFDPIVCLDTLCDYLDRSITKLKNNTELSSNLFRKIRECNNPARIMDFAHEVASDYLSPNTVLLGFEYGGIELPFVINAYRSYLGKNKLPCLTVNLSSYSTNSNRCVDQLTDALSPFANPTRLENKSVLLLDDSATTGRTIERLVGLLSPEVESIYLGIVSFTNTNRFHHLARLGHGGINPEVVKRTTCLYKSHFTQTYSKKSYTNKNGVFDSEKNKIIKLLNNI